MTRIANCSHDENGKYSGGTAGDQTGREWVIRDWYSRPWTVVLRHPNKETRELIARMAKNGAKNNNIGYDQGNRMSFYRELQKVDWIVKNVKTKCESDCSASTSAIVVGAGHRLKDKKLKKVNPANTTRSMREDFVKAGFKALDKAKYLKTSDYLLPGDILLCEGHHVTINLTKGKKA